MASTAAKSNQQQPAMTWPLVKLMRPKQWIKNAFVLAPLIFTGLFAQPGVVARSLVVVAIFCIAASAVYVLNDINDIEKDRLHPKKRYKRPLAAGAISVGTARFVLIVLWTIVAASAVLFPKAVAVIVGYILLNVLYSWRLKHVPVVDLFVVAAGFVLRVYAGAVGIGVPVSSWMLICTLCLALYLAATKRRQELAANGHTARSVLGSYTVSLLDSYTVYSSLGALVFYGLFVMTVRPALAMTVPLVLFGLFRYRYIVERLDGGESPTDALWQDYPLALTVLAWVALSLYAVWPH